MRQKSKSIQKLLVANRGEIAIRILRTAREMGINTVAVYSEADAQSLHRFEADESVCIGPAESQKSYLLHDAVLDAAKRTGADAIHPGYGFLSENTAFARSVQKAGILFVGPDPEMIEAMGDKVKARETVLKKSVPVVPGTGGITQLDTGLKTILELQKSRSDFKFPLLIKAAGGGGGKGMRIVSKAEDLKESLERAQSESIKAFGNPMVFVERYIEKPRHIEVQILGDGKNFGHLFERECSLQRRHQKVVEEALSPSIDDDIRNRITKAAVLAAESVNYKTIGTVEFVVSPQGDFYFLEMNTRIQVEHPVTEWISGVDLVRTQIDLALGNSLHEDISKVVPRGHSIEARLYAEDCENAFLPQPGHLHLLQFPHWTGVRVDAAVQSPCEVLPHYDPMIAKISAWAPTREECRRRLSFFLEKTKLEGLISNRSFLIEILGSDFFKSGRYHTQLLEDSSWRKKAGPSDELLASLCLKSYLDRGVAPPQNSSLSSWQVDYALDS